MSDAPPGPGPFEAAALKRLASPGWRTVTVEQTGPDGTEVLSVVYFHICPICGGMVPPVEGEYLIDEHRDYHLAFTQMMDEMLAAVTGALGVKQSCTYPGCEATEGLIAPAPSSSNGFLCAEHYEDAPIAGPSVDDA